MQGNFLYIYAPFPPVNSDVFPSGLCPPKQRFLFTTSPLPFVCQSGGTRIFSYDPERDFSNHIPFSKYINPGPPQLPNPGLLSNTADFLIRIGGVFSCTQSFADLRPTPPRPFCIYRRALSFFPGPFATKRGTPPPADSYFRDPAAGSPAGTGVRFQHFRFFLLSTFLCSCGEHHFFFLPQRRGNVGPRFGDPFDLVLKGLIFSWLLTQGGQFPFS